jgi:hypothetical protein
VSGPPPLPAGCARDADGSPSLGATRRAPEFGCRVPAAAICIDDGQKLQGRIYGAK